MTYLLFKTPGSQPEAAIVHPLSRVKRVPLAAGRRIVSRAGRGFRLEVLTISS